MAVSAAARSLAGEPRLGHLAGRRARSGRSIPTSSRAGAAGRNTEPGVAGDLLVHLVSGMMFMLGHQPAAATGGWPSAEFVAGRTGATCRTFTRVVYYYGDLPVYMRLNLARRDAGDLSHSGVEGASGGDGLERELHAAELGDDTYPSYYTGSFPRAMREAVRERSGTRRTIAKLAQRPIAGISDVQNGPTYDDLGRTWRTFFDAVRTRKPVVEDACSGTTRRSRVTWRTSPISENRRHLGRGVESDQASLAVADSLRFLRPTASRLRKRSVVLAISAATTPPRRPS